MTEELKEEVIEEKETKKNKKEKKKEEKVFLTKEEIEAINKKANDAEEKALRCQAELVNYRRRKDEEVQKLLKYCNLDLISELLPVIDNFERALSVKDESKLSEGVNMIYTSLINTLNKYGVKEIESLGQKFDPTYHEAVITDHDDEKEEDIILEVLQKGYILKDKVIRPAMVKVNK